MAQRVWIEAGRDNLTVVSAGCAFCALFAIFPALSALPTAPATVENQLSMLPAVLADRSLRQDPGGEPEPDARLELRGQHRA